MPLFQLCKGKNSLQLEAMSELYLNELAVASAAARGEHIPRAGEGDHSSAGSVGSESHTVLVRSWENTGSTIRLNTVLFVMVARCRQYRDTPLCRSHMSCVNSCEMELPVETRSWFSPGSSSSKLVYLALSAVIRRVASAKITD